MATLFLSQGVPMLLGGDELSRSQRGNNNAYCQDNRISWYDWVLDDEKKSFLKFVREIIAFRRAHPSFRRQGFLNGNAEGEVRDVTWWHASGRPMETDDWRSESLASFGMLLSGELIADRDAEGASVSDGTFLVLLNASSNEMTFRLPVGEAGSPDLWEAAHQCDGIEKGTRWGPGASVSLEPGSLAVLVALPG